MFLNCEMYNQHIFLVCQKQKYAPSVFEKYTTTISLGSKEIKLNLYDTAGKNAYQNLNPTRHTLLWYDYRSLLLGERTRLDTGLDDQNSVFLKFFYVKYGRRFALRARLLSGFTDTGTDKGRRWCHSIIFLHSVSRTICLSDFICWPSVYFNLVLGK